MRTGQNIYKRRDGRWEARVPLGKKADGRPHFKYLYASTYREVLLQKNNYEKTISLKNTQVISNALFSDAAYNWLLNSARRWKPSTYIKYKNCLEKYILPQWKKYYVRDIQQGTYDRLMEFLQQELSGGSIRTINTIISGILKHTLNYLPVKCTGTVSDHAKRPLDILSDGESCRLLAYLEDSNDLISIGIRLTLFSGIRLGEVGGLKWKDVDFKNNCININRSLSCNYIDGVKKIMLTTPKTHNSYRTIPFMGEAREMFLAQKEKQDALRKKLGSRYRGKGEFSDLVFCTTMGSPILRYHAEKECKKVVKEINETEAYEAARENRVPVVFEDVYPHAIRHTFCSRCFESDIKPKIVQALMGHQHYSTTIEIYTHVTQLKFDEEVKKFGRAL